MARKKKCDIMSMILIAFVALLIAYLLFNQFSSNERFTNVNKEDFDNMRQNNTCGSCST